MKKGGTRPRVRNGFQIDSRMFDGALKESDGDVKDSTWLGGQEREFYFWSAPMSRFGRWVPRKRRSERALAFGVM